MINDINVDKILERQDNGNVNILHVIATPQYLSLEVEDKIKGEIWQAEFSMQKIQEITLKAKNPKKYSVFIKMLMSSLMSQTESVFVEILTYAELQRKMNIPKKNKSDSRKFVIVTYMSEFDKAHYPLPLNYLENPSIDRLRITIRRLSQQLTLNGQQRGGNSQSLDGKQISMLKYENQTLKARIKSLEQKLHQSLLEPENNMDKSNIINEQKQVKRQLQNTKNLLASRQTQIQQLKKQIKQLNEESMKKQNVIIDLKQQITDNKESKVQKRQQQQTFALLEGKFTQMNKQMSELVAQLQHSREQQKKSIIKIENLEKQLQKMMSLQQKRKIFVTSNLQNNLSYSRKSQSQKSEKSFASQKSKKSNQSNRSNQIKGKNGVQAYLTKPINNIKANKPTTKRSSVYDSDTESSKLRKANNSKVSSFRQTNSKPLSNVSNSSKRASNNFTSTMNRFDRNILNNRERSRSKSRSVKKENSPPADFPTDNFASSSQDQRNITQALTKLKQRKNRVQLNGSKQRNQRKTQKNVMGPLQKKITNIAQMLRKAKSRQGRQ